MLRVISGSAKGHKLKTLKGSSTRPTTDRVKESLFNILAGVIADAQVIDLFAGTGNLGIEALSRGAASAIFVDKNSECAEIIKDNLTHTKLLDKALVLTGDVVKTLSRLEAEGRAFDIVFLDPPYNKNLVQETLAALSNSDIVKDDAIIIAERDYPDTLPEMVGNLSLIREQKYGDTVLSFYKVIKCI